MMISNKPQTITEVVKTGVSVWKSTLKQTIPFGFIFAMMMVGFHFIFPMPDDSKSHMYRQPAINWNGDIGLIIVYSILLLAVLLIVHAAVVARINAAIHDKYLQFNEAIFMGFQKAFSLLLVMVLSGIAVMIGFLLVIPGIALSVFLIFSTYIVIIEEKGIIGSMKESIRLVSGNWWRTFGTLCLISLVYFIFSFLFNLIVIGLDILLVVITKVLFNQATNSQEKYIFLINSIIIMPILYPFYYACIIAMFYDLKLKKNKDASFPTSTDPSLKPPVA